MPGGLIEANFGNFHSAIESLSRKLLADDIVNRIWAKDHTVWKGDPDGISNRLGWLDCPESMRAYVPEIMEFTAELKADEISDILLAGMGGSSLSPEFFGSVKIKGESRFDFHVLDSTHPAVVRKFSGSLNPLNTLYIISTKSGGTVETISLLKYFYNLARDAVGEDFIGKHFVAITDPGSGLEKIAREYNFRKIFLGNPRIGGRFSALSHFGLVPAALNGWDISLLLDRARQVSQECRLGENNPGIITGAMIGGPASLGINKLYLVLPGPFELFGAWVEQLIAESTGKDGKGVVPIICGSIDRLPEYPDDGYMAFLRIGNDSSYDGEFEKRTKSGIPSIRIDLKDIYDFGGQFFLWGFATALAGHILGVQPFDQPDVEAAKSAAREMVIAYRSDGKMPEPERLEVDENVMIYNGYSGDSVKSILNQFFEKAENKTGSYLSVQAYLNPTKDVKRLLHDFQVRIEKKLRLPVTVGFGPRYLHSTGQLHKGDAGKGFFIQLLEQYEPDMIIPDDFDSNRGSITFGTLIKAQCLGDREALLRAKRNVLSISFNADTLKGIGQLISAL